MFWLVDSWQLWLFVVWGEGVGLIRLVVLPLFLLVLYIIHQLSPPAPSAPPTHFFLLLLFNYYYFSHTPHVNRGAPHHAHPRPNAAHSHTSPTNVPTQHRQDNLKSLTPSYALTLCSFPRHTAAIILPCRWKIINFWWLFFPPLTFQNGNTLFISSFSLFSSKTCD